MGSWENGDNGGETGEEPKGVEYPCLNYSGFCFFYYGFSKMDEIHIMCDIYMDEAGIPMPVTMSKE